MFIPFFISGVLHGNTPHEHTLLYTLLKPFSKPNSRLRRLSLYIFARFIELPMLRLAYHVCKGKLAWINKIPLANKLIGRLIVYYIGNYGDTAKPVPYEQLLSILDDLGGEMAVGSCRCRLAVRACDHPLETDIVIKIGVKPFSKAFPDDYKPAGKDEIIRIITHCHELRMFHLVFVHCPVNLDNEYVICNCCTCGCIPYMVHRRFGQRNLPLLTYYRVEMIDGRCAKCWDCLEDICPFDARVMGDDGVVVQGCMGCGLCLSVCENQAMRLVKVKPIIKKID